MKRTGLLCALILLARCVCLPEPAGAQVDPDAERLRAELIKALTENLDLKLKLARVASRPEDELRVLEEAVASDHAEVCAAAFRELGALPEERRKAAVPAVLRRGADAGGAFRIQAIPFLARVTSPEAGAFVLSSTTDAHPAVRAAAARALKSSVSEKAAPALIALLADPDKPVRLAALDSLGAAGRDVAVGPLVRSLSTEKDAEVLEKTVDALGAIGSIAAVGELLKLLERTNAHTLRWYCINSLGKIGDRSAAEALRPYLGASEHVTVRQVTLEAIGKLKDAGALPRLGAVLRDDPEESLRQAAAVSIGLVADASAIETLLLPAWLAEKSATVRVAAWAAIETLLGGRFDDHESLANALLKKGLSADADRVCARLHGTTPRAELLDRHLAIEEAVAGALYGAGDFKAALPHYDRLLALAPDRPDARLRAALCHREIKDIESALKLFREREPKLPVGEPAWWEHKMEYLKTLQMAKDPEPLAEVAHALLLRNPPPHPEERRKALEQAFRAGAVRMAQALRDPDETVRKAAPDAIKRSGKKLLPAFAAELEEGKHPPAPVIEAGNLIAGTAFDPAKPESAKAAAAEWKAKN